MWRYVAVVNNFKEWRSVARSGLTQLIPPEEIFWGTLQQAPLFPLLPLTPEQTTDKSLVSVPRAFFSLAELASCHSSQSQWSPLYTVLWRIAQKEKEVLENVGDPQVRELFSLSRQVEKDIHQMHAFVRFTQEEVNGEELYRAWYEPDHFIIEKAAPFFVRRFGTMRWALLTPKGGAFWDLHSLTYKAVSHDTVSIHEEVPSQKRMTDSMEELWKEYYSAIFNPARVNVPHLCRELPKRRWKNLPEAAVIEHLVRTAPQRVEEMNQQQQKQQALYPPVILPSSISYAELRQSAQCCTACPLYKVGTQTVFGEGPLNADIFVVGEQPGDNEDYEGKPFIGPAGEILSEALAQAGLTRSSLYITNAVKHFKWEARGKRRIHQRPNGAEINACRPWLLAEISQVQPKLIIALGATAAQSLLGRKSSVQSERGRLMQGVAGMSTVTAPLMITLHPSAILRVPDEKLKKEAFQLLVEDLLKAKGALEILPQPTHI